MITPDINTLYAIAEDQAGYFTAKQALQAGYSRQRLYDLANRGQFVRVEHGIYRLARFPASRFEDLQIASLRIGPGAVVSHESALAVYDLSDVMPGKIHIIMPRSGSRRRKNIQLHTNKLEAHEITKREGLRITTVDRTLADVIVGGISFQHADQAIQEAIKRGLTTRSKLLNYARRRGGISARIINQILKEETL